MEQLKNLSFDFENGRFLVNGSELPKDTTSLSLTFKDGVWDLKVGSPICFTTRIPHKKEYGIHDYVSTPQEALTKTFASALDRLQ